ncbi:hypothetical protein [Wenzhouxiangella marina]|uniref:Integrin alpha beta-propellor repeat protein n=1 Tax=Wenzhouxiangella marina TaxID=1579979 RepID=A0A0K0XUE0_9GAMM|nr:hypothetical protein [Wenzhouxiangella marina]AKS41280.1 Integrin alpha beta-propellor repeat protein [Wenzhouxiangella marina]MBB6086970.1 hypothetical protein [Wenzhouxiangella marina]
MRSRLVLSTALVLSIIACASPVRAQFDQAAYLKSMTPDAIQRGQAVALSGRLALLSGLEGNAEGTVAVFEQGLDGQWAFQSLIKAGNAQGGDQFGVALAVDGDTIVVGAPGEDSAATGIGGDQGDDSAEDAGAVYVYVRAQDQWVEQAYIKPSNTDAGDQFGFSVALYGDTLVVGAPGEDGGDSGVGGNPGSNALPTSGAAYVFVRSGGSWSQQAYLKASNTDAADAFGTAVDVYRAWIAVGAPFEASAATGLGGNAADDSASGAGAAYAFKRQGVNWSPLGYLKASNTDAGDRFGTSVALTGSPTLIGHELLLIVGAPGESSLATGIGGNQNDNAASDAGAAYAFLGNGTGGWGQIAYLKASNTGADDEFGQRLAVSDGTTRRIVVGASREDSLGTGVDGVQADNSAPQAGAAYLFLENNQSVQQEHYLKASNTGGGDRFGYAVAVDRSLILIGAPLEDSAALGVGGDQQDDSASNAGAAYLFSLPDGVFADRFD